MSRFSFEEMDLYGGQKSNYFSLKDDGDTAKVRFLLNDINDLQGVVVHSVSVGDREIDVECLRAYNEPVAKCPLCTEGYETKQKLFIPIYDMSAKESKIWTRGKTFFNKLSSLCARYNPLVGTPIEIERVGAKGSRDTTYETFPGTSDNAKITDFPEINPEGICFQVKTAEDMEYYIQNGVFPEDNQQPTRRVNQERPSRRSNRETPATPVRRRPNYNNEDEF